MSIRDFRSLVSQVSLFGAETALVLLQREGDHFIPISLPLWGRYEGCGTLSEVEPGPNAELVLSAFQRALQEGQASIDWNDLGVPPCDVDHIETLLSLIACAQLHGKEALTWHGSALGFALLSGHVAAALMTREPCIESSMSVEELPAAVLKSPSSAAIYGSLGGKSLTLKCKFGLSFVGFFALEETMSAENIHWIPTTQVIEEGERNADLWLAEAMVRFSENAEILEALEDYGARHESFES